MRAVQAAIGCEERLADAPDERRHVKRAVAAAPGEPGEYDAIKTQVRGSSTEKPVHCKIRPMSLALGSRLAGYELTGHLGAGGMGEVYQATDTKLKRKVAIKVLPEAFATDPDRVARFHREAQAVAALNHSGIAAIYDLAEAGGTTFLVLELIDGETLASGSRRPAADEAGHRETDEAPGPF